MSEELEELVEELEETAVDAEEVEELVELVEELKESTVDVPAVEVKVSALTYSATRKNSASVAALQSQLAVCGYSVVRADLSGWFHDNTREAVSQWQADQGLDVSGTCTYGDMEFLFHGAEVKLI